MYICLLKGEYNTVQHFIWQPDIIDEKYIKIQLFLFVPQSSAGSWHATQHGHQKVLFMASSCMAISAPNEQRKN
jgi:hypothetical protein